jgi:hypothetical protein
VKTTAALFITIGLAFAGFGSAGYAARADTGTSTATTTAGSPCTRDHPCPDPGCSVTGFGPGDCFTQATETATTPTTETATTETATTETATTETTTTATTETTTTDAPQSPCTRAHPCPNPGCAEAGFGPGDCFTPTPTQQTTPTPTTDTTPTTTAATTSTATTDTTPTTGTTQVGATQTGITATSPVATPPVAATTTGATTTTAPATTTTATAPFLPPAAPTKPKPPPKAGPFAPPPAKVQAASSTNPAVTLPFTGVALSPFLLVAFGLIGLGLLTWWLGRENA